MKKFKQSELFDPITALTVYVPGLDGSGTVCIGHLVLRARSGVEGFDAHDRSIGFFPDQKAAADALSEATV